MRISDWSSDVCSSDLRAARAREMVEQGDEKGQVVRLHPLFIEGEDETPARGFEQIIAVLHPLGNALARHDRADVVARDERGEFVGIDMGVNGHLDRKSTRLNSSH